MDVLAAIKAIVVSGSLIVMGGFIFGCLLVWLSRLSAASFRLSLTANVVQRPFNRIVFLVSVVLACLYGGAKNEGLNGAGAGAAVGAGTSGLMMASITGIFVTSFFL